MAAAPLARAAARTLLARQTQAAADALAGAASAALPWCLPPAACVHSAAAAQQQQQRRDPTAARGHQLRALHSHHHSLHHSRLHHGAACTEPHDDGAASAGSGSDSAAAGPRSFEQQELECWSCHDRHHRGGLVCQACDKIQPIDPSLTYFDLLGYPQPAFDLDPAGLERRYKLLQWQLHPDRAVTKTPREREYSAEQATLINQAYGVLRSPLARANYMLMLAGVPAGEHFEGTITDPELLMEVMEAREAVEQEGEQEALVRLHTANRARCAALCGELSRAFGAGDLEAARRLVAQLTYWVRLGEAIADKL